MTHMVGRGMTTAVVQSHVDLEVRPALVAEGEEAGKDVGSCGTGAGVGDGAGLAL